MGCICADGLSQCLPTDCPMKNNACCPEGLFWDPIKSCCTSTLRCNPSCGEDEICTNITNIATCVCNNDFYKQNTTADIIPFVTCGLGVIELYVASRCLLDYLGYDYKNLLLGNAACTFSFINYYNNKPVVILQLKAESGWCGNKLTLDSSSFHYTNTLHIGIKNESLITVNPIFFNFTCSYNLTQNTSLPSSIHFSSCSSNTTNTSQSIVNSCPTSNATIFANIISNGNSSETRIQFRSFQFQGYDDLFIFCDVTVCTGNCSMKTITPPYQGQRCLTERTSALLCTDEGKKSGNMSVDGSRLPL
ncbi:uncharacterized protein [Phyllobates terribilis]|uniref:uncharacterized protein n=1 Tax=Phyllobates terribilis TaxID=111132 RepID=UPI003CCAFF05